MLGILGKTENFFTFLNKKKTSLFVSFFVLLGFLIPNVSYAGLAANIANAILMAIFGLVADILVFFVGLAGDLLNWVMSPNFIAFSYTNPYGSRANPVVAEGLKVTQGLVNMILILVIVYIAIATILRLSDYNTQKLLITFFIVALLVNFAPVLCGIIVDASNIVMNFFIKDLSAEGFGNVLGSKVEEISKGFKSAEWENAGKYMWQMAALIPFLLMLIVILLAFAVLFTLRYLVIWILVILAPLAFAAYILPNTRKYFEQWWRQLINWSFVGATCGFFLYLSFLLLNRVPDAISRPVTTGEPTSVFNSILPYFVSVVFLGLGFYIGLKTSAMGAGVVINAIKSRASKTTNWAKQKSWRATKWAGAGVGTGVGTGVAMGARKTGRTIRDKMAESEKVQKFAQRMAASKRWGEGQKGIMGAVKRTADVKYYAKRVAGKAAGANFADQQKDSIKKKQENLKNKDKNTVLKEFHAAGTAGNKANRVATLNVAIEAGDIDDLMDAKKYGKNAITKEDIEQTFKFAKNIGADKTIKNAFVEMAAKNVSSEKLAEAKIKNPKVNTRMKVIVNEMKQKDYENVSRGNIKNKEFMAAVLEFADGKSIGKLIEKHGNEAAGAVEQRIDDGDYVNPRIIKYLSSTAGAGLISPNNPKWNTVKPESVKPVTTEQKIKEEKEALRKISKPQSIWEAYKRSKAQEEERRAFLDRRKRKEERKKKKI